MPKKIPTFFSNIGAQCLKIWNVVNIYTTNFWQSKKILFKKKLILVLRRNLGFKTNGNFVIRSVQVHQNIELSFSSSSL